MAFAGVFVGLFQPALPMRGVTRRTAITRLRYRISTRTPHAGSDTELPDTCSERFLISTRTPHAGSDLTMPNSNAFTLISTRTPHAGSDRAHRRPQAAFPISTRTPHAGSDSEPHIGALPE